ncbi:unnamed protein product [Jaminaea pallidilutea]
MPAKLGPCTACSKAESKYKCPTCNAPTCSLPCSKAHRATHPGTSSAGSPDHIASNGLRTSGSSNGGYVPLKDYDASRFLQDYRFLENIGRQVSAAGKSLLAQGLLPQQVEATTNAAGDHTARTDNNNAVAGPSYRPDFDKVKQLKRRRQLQEYVRSKRCKVMWLPEGMARETRNRTGFLDRQCKKLRWTCEVAWAGSEREDRSGPELWTDVPPMLPLEVKVMGELERESLRRAPEPWKQSSDGAQALGERNATQSSRDKGRKRGRGRARAGEDSEEANNAAEGTAPQASTRKVRYYVSDAVLHDKGLLPPPSSSGSPSTEPKVYSSFPSFITLAVQVHHTKLRNESSLKYLEWWERKGKEDERLAEEELREAVQRAEAEAAREAFKQQALSSTIPTGPRSMVEQGQPSASHPASNASLLPAAASSLLPPHLLAQLSGKLEASRKDAAARSEALQLARAEAQVQATQSPTKGPVGAFKSSKESLDLGYSDESDDGFSSAATAATTSSARRMLYLVPSSKNASQGHQRNDESATSHGENEGLGGPGIEALLRSLPRHYAVVEFPRIEVWNTQRLQKESEKSGKDAGGVHLVRWEVEGPGDKDDTDDDKIEDNAAAAAAAAETSKQDQLQAAVAGSIATAQAPQPLMTTKPSGALGLAGLAAYDSDDDDDDDGAASEGDIGGIQLAATTASTPEDAQADQGPNKRARTLAQQELLNVSEAISSPIMGESGEDEQEAQPQSLASIARQFGFVSQGGVGGGTASKTDKELTSGDAKQTKTSADVPAGQA